MKRQLWCLAAAIILAAGIFTAIAYGAEAAVSLEGPEQAAPDSSFTVALHYDGDTFLSASAEVVYDPEILEFRSCSGGEGFAEEGLARINLSGGDGKVYLSCKLRFKALKEGESFITVTTSSLQNEEEAELIVETRSIKVLVTEAAEDEAAEADTPDEDWDEEESGSTGSEEGKDEIYLLNAAKKAAFRVLDGFSELIAQLSVTEFLLFSMCITVILLLLVLLAAGKRR